MSLFAKLLCALEGHRAEPRGQWNRGYCFSRCARCGRDMIRLGSGQWQVPKGYRVVWKRKDEVLPNRRPSAPARTRRSPPASIIAAPPAASAPEPPPADPIDDWLADLPAAPPARAPDPGDFMSDGDTAVPAPPPPAGKYRVGQ